ncbi:4-amino-4-deoxy-L-arabinose-phosphoundecaprenol flippase subunit ArnE [Marinomonas sp.]|uniref:4-amino-4-deoxy-L-arabinose-phosphoundecaprenol flippase subunit ArnE n=1 Tax=Marinomonas sp. TaxID=1904862 RepID=UPI003BAA3F68
MTVALVILTLLLTCTGQILQKQCAVSLDSKSRNWLLLSAIACLGFGALAWLLVLQQLPVGIAYPMLSLNYVLVMLASRYWFKEPVSLRQWFGVLLVITGVSLLGGKL